MVILYRLLMALVQALLTPAGWFNGSGKIMSFVHAHKKGIPGGVLPKSGKRYWFHCASLGEFEQARPLMESLKAADAHNSIVITFFSPSGYSQRFDYELADMVLYLPLDTPRNAARLLDYLHPDVAVFVKYEIWYFHLKAIFTRQIPCYLISAVFREGQFLFSPAGSWLFGLLPQYTRIFVQDKASLERLQGKGLNNVVLSGDTRYDRVKQNALRVKMNERIQAFKSGQPLLVLGSSWQPEEALLLDFLKTQKNSQMKVMIAPHDISEGHISEIMTAFSEYAPMRYTGNQATDQHRILVLDTMGHLASAYVYADLALVGGGFGKGLHNILEPLSFGVPVLFGPNVDKYPEAAWAREAAVAAVVEDAAAMARMLGKWLGEEQTEIKARCIDFINWHAGATALVMKEISADIEKKSI